MSAIRLWVVLLCLPIAADAQVVTGSIAGVVQSQDGGGIGGVTVSLAGTERTAITGEDGTFAFDDVPEGGYSVVCRLGDRPEARSEVRVPAGERAEVTVTADWQVTFADTITVSASRRPERIVEAPGAVTVVGDDVIRLEGAAGQIPKLLEFTVGVQVTQSGLYDFNLNTRGFNQTLTRRVQTLMDGRDVSIPFVASQEWLSMSLLSDDLASVELLRGPSAALYGANSFNGVLNLVTKPPNGSEGGRLSLVAGELSTLRAEVRWAGELAPGWYAKILGGHAESGSFTQSRDASVEYPGLALEAVPLPANDSEIDSGLLRIDRELSRSRSIVVEGGISKGGGDVRLSPPGRTFVPDLERTWTRLDYSAPRYNFLAYTNTRKAPDQVFLSANSRLFLDEENWQVELQTNRDLPGSRGRWVGGFSYGEETVDSADRGGMQTLVGRRVESNAKAVFAQLDRPFGDRLKLVLAARWDESTLHNAELSPKGSLVYAINPSQTLRLTYNQAFQAGNYGELFVAIPAAPPLDLSAVESALAPLLGGVPLGLGSVPILALGNEDLDVEQIRSIEAGYSGILGRSVFLTVDYYRNQIKDFISDLAVGTNPAFGPYRAPAQLPPAVAAEVSALLNSLVPGLSNGPSGGPALVLSYGNAGEVESQGVESSLQWQIQNAWALDLNYSWFEVTDRSDDAKFEANAPRNTVSLGLTYRRGPFASSLHYRWVEEHDWASGVYVGTVPSYKVANLAASYDLSDRWSLGLDVSNLFNEAHYELFGGDVLKRRALGYVTVSW